MLRRLFAASAPAVFALALAACATGPDVRTDFDRSADFSAYQTFRIMNRDEGAGPRAYDTLTDQRIQAAIVRELEARGYRRVEDAPDLLVNFTVSTKDIQEVRQVPAGPQPYGWYGWRDVYSPWPTYSYETWVDNYTQGALYVDLVDAERRQLVWEGEVQGRITDEMRRNPEPAITGAVEAIFARYPFRAGSGVPVEKPGK
jgi:hypothetical protein